MRTRLSRITGFLAIAGALCCSCEETEESILESISIEPASLELTVGSTAVLELRAVPETYMMKGEVIWSSSDPSVVTVDEKGVASGVKEGTASVTAAVDGQEARCDITVVSEVTSFSIDPAQADMVVGDILQLKAVTVPDGIDGEVLWSSSDESVAAVSAAGEVSAVSAGNVTVTASFKDLTAECEISVSDPEPAKVGDFFYDDGTWSSDLREDKTCIGVVFYTGNPAVHDESLKREHPDCVNGLVVALNEIPEITWQSAYMEYGVPVGEWVENNLTDYVTPSTWRGYYGDETNPDWFNKIMGYNNTRALEAFNKAQENSAWPVEAVSAVVSYRETVPAPENTSGWYLPSIKELSVLSGGESDENIWDLPTDWTSVRELLNDRLYMLDAELITDKHYYWSSSDDDGTTGRAYALYTFYGVPYDMHKELPEIIRPVLAF